MAVEQETLLALGATMAAMQTASTPIRRHSYQQPPFYALPLAVTSCRYLVGNSGWVRRLVVPPRTQYLGVVTSYAIAADVPLEGAGLEFRWLVNGAVVPSVVITDTDICRDTDVTSWPAFKRSTYLTFSAIQQASIEVRNTGAVTRRVFLGAFGFYYPSSDATELGTEGADRHA